MADALQDIVQRLEQQRDAIERALTALREVEGENGPAPQASQSAPSKTQAGPRKAKRKGGMTPEGRARLIAALKRRWAKQKAGQSGAGATKKSAAKKSAPKKAAAKQAPAAKKAAAKRGRAGKAAAPSAAEA